MQTGCCVSVLSTHLWSSKPQMRRPTGPAPARARSPLPRPGGCTPRQGGAPARASRGPCSRPGLRRQPCLAPPCTLRRARITTACQHGAGRPNRSCTDTASHCSLSLSWAGLPAQVTRSSVEEACHTGGAKTSEGLSRTVGVHAYSLSVSSPPRLGSHQPSSGQQAITCISRVTRHAGCRLGVKAKSTNKD